MTDDQTMFTAAHQVAVGYAKRAHETKGTAAWAKEHGGLLALCEALGKASGESPETIRTAIEIDAGVQL